MKTAPRMVSKELFQKAFFLPLNNLIVRILCLFNRILPLE